ncbi:MAG TPA: IclR family transcriptional regulator [Solirubrobacteraceae bacterium]|jgi:IclR family pca regulon transcriptional regulator
MPPRAGTSYPDTWRIPDLSEPRYSQSLERGLAILECFTPETPVLGIADIATQLGMSRSTTHRYVTTLLALGYLQQGARRKYRLGLRVTALGMSALNETSMREHAHADLAELAHRAGYATSIAVLEDDEVLYVDRVQGFRRRQQVPGPAVKAGSRLPAYCTALGKVLLAHLPEHERREILSRLDLKRQGPNVIVSKNTLRDELAQILEEGLAVEDQELAEGRIAIAAPVFDEAGEIAAAIDLTAGAETIAVEELADALGPHLVSTADRISSRLGNRRESEGRD